MTLEQLGQRIQHYRQLRGWTKTELGKRLGLAHASIVRLEKGQQNIPVQLLFALAETLEVTLWDLLGDDEEPSLPRQLPPGIHQLVMAVMPLNSTAIAHLTEFVLTVHEHS